MELDDYYLDQVIEAAVIESWSDLMPNGKNGLVHVEYHFAEKKLLAIVRAAFQHVNQDWGVCTGMKLAL